MSDPAKTVTTQKAGTSGDARLILGQLKKRLVQTQALALKYKKTAVQLQQLAVQRSKQARVLQLRLEQASRGDEKLRQDYLQQKDRFELLQNQLEQTSQDARAQSEHYEEQLAQLRHQLSQTVPAEDAGQIALLRQQLEEVEQRGFHLESRLGSLQSELRDRPQRAELEDLEKALLENQELVHEYESLLQLRQQEIEDLRSQHAEASEGIESLELEREDHRDRLVGLQRDLEKLQSELRQSQQNAHDSENRWQHERAELLSQLHSERSAAAQLQSWMQSSVEALELWLGGNDTERLRLVGGLRQAEGKLQEWQLRWDDILLEQNQRNQWSQQAIGLLEERLAQQLDVQNQLTQLMQQQQRVQGVSWEALARLELALNLAEQQQLQLSSQLQQVEERGQIEAADLQTRLSASLSELEQTRVELALEQERRLALAQQGIFSQQAGMELERQLEKFERQSERDQGDLERMRFQLSETQLRFALQSEQDQGDLERVRSELSETQSRFEAQSASDRSALEQIRSQLSDSQFRFERQAESDRSDLEKLRTQLYEAQLHIDQLETERSSLQLVVEWSQQASWGLEQAVHVATHSEVDRQQELLEVGRYAAELERRLHEEEKQQAVRRQLESQLLAEQALTQTQARQLEESRIQLLEARSSAQPWLVEALTRLERDLADTEERFVRANQREAGLAQDLSQLGRQTEQLEEQLDRQHRQLENYQSQLAQLREQLDREQLGRQQAQDYVHTLEEELAASVSRLEDLESRFSQEQKAQLVVQRQLAELQQQFQDQSQFSERKTDQLQRIVAQQQEKLIKAKEALGHHREGLQRLNLEKQALSQDLSELQQRLQNHDPAFQQLEEDLDRAQLRHLDSEMRGQDLLVELQSLARQTMAFEARLEEHQHSRGELERSLSEKLAQVDKLQVELGLLQDERESLFEEVSTLHDDLDQSRAHSKQVETALLNSQRQAGEHEESLGALRQQYETLETTHQDLGQRYLALEQSQDELNSRYQSLEKTHDEVGQQLRGELTRTSSELNTTASKLKLVHSKYNELKEAYKRQQTGRLQVDQNLQGREAEVKRLSEELSDHQTEMNRLLQDMEELQNERFALQQRLSDSEKREAASEQQILEAGEQARLAGQAGAQQEQWLHHLESENLRQAAEAQALASELRSLQSQLGERQGELGERTLELEELAGEFERLEASEEETRAQKLRLELENQALDRQLGELREQHQSQHQELETRNERVAKLENAVSVLAARLKEQQSDKLKTAQKSKADAQAMMEELETEIRHKEALEKQAEGQRQKITNLERELRKVQQELEGLESGLHSESEQSEKLREQGRQQALKAQLQESELQQAQLERESLRQQLDLQKMQSQMELENLRQKVAEQDQLLKSQETQNQDLQEQLELSSSILGEAEQQMTDLETFITQEREKTREQISRLEREKQELLRSSRPGGAQEAIRKMEDYRAKLSQAVSALKAERQKETTFQTQLEEARRYSQELEEANMELSEQVSELLERVREPGGERP